MTDLVFSRRALQDRLFDLEQVLDEVAHRDLVNRLNKPGYGRLASMWEAAWLAALNKVSRVAHEIPLPGGGRPDFRMTYSSQAGSVAIVGDITAASDQGLHAANPVELFWEEIVRLAVKSGLDPNHFSYNIGHRSEGAFQDSRTVLTLPAKTQMVPFIQVHVEPFIRCVAVDPTVKATLPYSAEGVSFTLAYNPNQEFAGGSHALYNVPYSYRRTPIYRALDKKTSKFTGAPEDAVRLVILCDAGCYAMRSSVVMGMGQLSAAQIIEEFLRTTTSVDAVLMVAVETVNPLDAFHRYRRLNATYSVAPMGSRQARLTPAAIAGIRELLDRAIKLMPQPMREPYRASNRNRPGATHGLHGAHKMSDRRLKLSSRAVQELLAGKLTPAEFNRLHNWGPDSTDGNPNPIALALERGATIGQVTIEPGGDSDDDWIEFTWQKGDPAISPFRHSVSREETKD